jgi:hypothetical protein
MIMIYYMLALPPGQAQLPYTVGVAEQLLLAALLLALAGRASQFHATRVDSSSPLASSSAAGLALAVAQSAAGRMVRCCRGHPTALVLALLSTLLQGTCGGGGDVSPRTVTKTYTPASSDTLDAVDFEGWLLSSAKAGANRLVLAPGRYTLEYMPRNAACVASGGCAHLNLTGDLRNLEIDMSGAELRPQAYNRTAVVVAGWVNVTFRGADIVYTDGAFSTNQANVVGVGPDSVEVAIPKGYPLRDWETGKTTPCSVFDPKGDFKWSLLSWSGSTPIATNGSARLYRLKTSTSGRVAVGDKLGCRQIWHSALTRTSSGSFVVIGCQDSHFIDITMRGSVAYAFYHVGSGACRAARSWTLATLNEHTTMVSQSTGHILSLLRRTNRRESL